jgi:hypothetical protein
MLNRSNALPKESLDARRAITHELRERLKEVPASPCDWTRTDELFAAPRLAALTLLLCSSQTRSAELQALWTESVITGAYSRNLAPKFGADASTSAIAGMLHRLGDILTIRAIAGAEQAAGMRIDAPSKADLCSQHGGKQLERTLRAWGVPPKAAATASQWRRLRDFPGAAAEASAVYLGRLLALELVAPQFCAPGAVDHAIEELGLAPNTLSMLRTDATIAALLISLK